MKNPPNPRKLRSRSSRETLRLLGRAALFSGCLTILGFGENHENSQRTEAALKEIVNDTDEDRILLPAPTRNVAKGEKLSAVPLTTIQWPKSRLSTEYLREFVASPQTVAGTALPKLLPIPLAALSQGLGEGNQVTERIPQGMRAITVRVDAESAVEGWAQSGNFVDVILVRSGKELLGGLESKVIAENVRILSAGRSAEPMGNEQTAPNPPSTVTLLVNQEDALKIKTGASLGKLTFALRGFSDQLPTTITRVDQRTLLGQPKSGGSLPSVIGTARGPDGQNYILNSGEKWTRAGQAREEDRS